jgi:HEAT repeat protein
VTRKIWSSLMIATAIAVAHPGIPAAVAQTSDAAVESAQRDLQQLAAILNDENARQSDRDEAARRLISRRTPEARQIIRAALVDLSRSGARIAAARGIASDPYPGEEFIEPLLAMLGSTRNLADAAAAALSNYKNNRDVLLGLTRRVNALQEAEGTRIAAIRALGTLSERRAAETLIEALRRPEESQAVRNAAADALVVMTRLTENGRDFPRWLQWWEANRNKSEVEFRTDILTAKSVRLELLEERYKLLGDELTDLLTAMYRDTPDAARPDRLMRYLKSAQPEIRLVGARIIKDDKIEARISPAVAREYLRTMVGDSSAAVRLEVAEALGALNDAEALEPLLAQLAQEPDPLVRGAIAEALANMRDLRVVPELLRLLEDPSITTAKAGASALFALGELMREKDPPLATRTAEALRRTLEQRTGDPGAVALREACVEALVPLRADELAGTLRGLLSSRETPRVRRFALKALGELRDEKNSDAIAESLDDPDSSVRLEAVIALGKSAALQYADVQLYRRLDPNIEPDASVRAQAWTVIESVLPEMSKEQLTRWADRLKSDPNRRFSILQALRDKLIKDRDDPSLAAVRQQIGETLMALNRPGDAVPYFRGALEYWRGEGAENMSTVTLMEQLLTAYLLDKQYAEAAQFVADAISRSPANQQLGSNIRRETERLRDAERLDDALALIAEAMKMQPPLSDMYLEDLRVIEREVQAMRSERTPATGPTGSARNPDAANGAN